MHERLSVNSVCFIGESLSDVADHWRALETRRVSMMSHELLGQDVAAIRNVLVSGNYTFETIAHPFLPYKPLQPQESCWRDARANLMQLIDIAAALGARSIYMLTGGHGTLTWEQAAETFSTAIAPCVTHARQVGVALAVENASVLHADNHIAHSLRDTLTLAEMANIGVCIDLYGCFTDAGLHELIRRAMPRCPVVQISDYVYGDRALPCRAVPGDGAVPLERVIGWMLAAGYTGTFDFELIGPRIEKEGRLNAVRRASHYMSELLQRLGA
jgi:sugar phosphate isomerase/epimerase